MYQLAKQQKFTIAAYSYFSKSMSIEILSKGD